MTLAIYKSALPCPEGALRASLQRYKDALQAHKLTENVPAPWPEYDVLRDVVAAGGTFVVLEDGPSVFAINGLAFDERQRLKELLK